MASLAQEELDDILSRVLAVVPPGAPLPLRLRRPAGDGGVQRKPPAPTEPPRVQQGVSSGSPMAEPAAGAATNPIPTAPVPVPNNNARGKSRPQAANAAVSPDLKRAGLRRSASDVSQTVAATNARTQPAADKSPEPVADARPKGKQGGGFENRRGEAEAVEAIADGSGHRHVRFDGGEEAVDADSEVGSRSGCSEEAGGAGLAQELFTTVRLDLLPVRTYIL